MGVDELISLVNTRYKLNLKLKPEQTEVLTLLETNKNVMAILPTGFGKSLLYLLPPLMLDEVCIYSHMPKCIAVLY